MTSTAVLLRDTLILHRPPPARHGRRTARDHTDLEQIAQTHDANLPPMSRRDPCELDVRVGLGG